VYSLTCKTAKFFQTLLKVLSSLEKVSIELKVPAYKAIIMCYICFWVETAMLCRFTYSFLMRLVDLQHVLILYISVCVEHVLVFYMIICLCTYPTVMSVLLSLLAKSKLKSKSKLLYDWQSVSQYVLVSNTLVGLAIRYYCLSECYCLKFAVLYLWGALSYERTGLQSAM
jgi:hypothetical protein